MTKLKALPGGVESGGGQGGPPRGAKPKRRDDEGPRLAPGAPPSAGTLPLEFAQLLRRGEAVVWWDEKERVSWRPVLWTVVAGLVILGGVSAFAPELWQQPLNQLWKPVAAIFSPAAFVFAREFLGRRALVVTDNSIIDVDWRGRSDRIGFRTIRRVRRDFLTGGVLLEGEAHKVRVPPALSERAREAIASQTVNMIRASNDGPVDSLGWLP